MDMIIFVHEYSLTLSKLNLAQLFLQLNDCKHLLEISTTYYNYRIIERNVIFIDYMLRSKKVLLNIRDKKFVKLSIKYNIQSLH